MRIAFVIYGSLETISGGFIYDRALVGALGALGHRVDVVGLPWRGYFRALAGSLLTPGRARRHRRQEDGESPLYDVVIHDELVHPALIGRRPGATPAAGPRGQSVVALVHNLTCQQPGHSFPARAVKARVESRYLASVDGVIAVCQQTMAGVRALIGAATPGLIAYPGRDHLAPEIDEEPDEALDQALIEKRSAEPGPLRVLHAASMTPGKGLHRLLAALAGAIATGASGDFTLDVVGSQPRPAYLRAVRRQVARLGLGARVRLHGELRGRELRQIFRRSQILALPSDREAYSLACLEALGFGLPVLATSSGGLGEMIRDGQEGFLIDPLDRGGWTAALGRLGADRDALAVMGRAALARHRGHATWRQVALKVQGFLETLGPRPPAPADAAR